ncbi:hypothetical protein RCL_jg28598.t1 [Rhizophagus clarus]|uniref:Uncharacterized protein n=1 Tax=Rhizophagus clarus TaxID=94130 RepID=A0A8H3LUQ4_9GLOM|nr:hypothetical protein RCL_jg28598.t1 [Rhizophagus clarus]
MPSVFSTIEYIVEAKTTTLNSSDNSTFTKGIIACNRPEKNDPIFTEIPITCICPIHNLRLSNKVNKLQKGNKLDTIGNLIKNEDEIIVTVTYIVYANNMNSHSSFDKKDTMTKLPWLDPSKVTSEDPSQDVNSDFFNSINNYKYGKVDQSG